MNNQTAIQVSHVNHSFGEGDVRKQVLFDNNLVIGQGELVIMTGPSGSGKTTLLTLVGALRAPQDGSIQVLGQELMGVPAAALVHVRRNLGFIFQMHNLFDSLSAIENVRMSMELHKYPTKELNTRAIAMLEKLGLGERVHYKPRALSGGQRQRVAIARALVNRPKLILADEPTAALDKKSSRDVVDLLKGLTREVGSTILMVTHDNRILDVADRIVNMVDGYIASDVAVGRDAIIIDLLKKSEVFEHLGASQALNCAEKMNSAQYQNDQVIFRQGDEGDKFYLIEEGNVQVLVNNNVIADLGKGEFFGEAALLTGEPRNATVVVKGGVTVLILSKEDFKMTLAAAETFDDQLRKVAFQRSLLS